MKAKRRVDQALIQDGLIEEITRAQALIMAGKVYLGEQKIYKPGHLVACDAILTVRGQEHPWVSRGRQKLDHAIQHFGLDPTAAVAADLGCSTGGFTDVLLHYGASRVYAVDVGNGQLAWKLREDQRVVVMERTNARHLTMDKIPEPLNWIVCDASFIGLRTILPAAMALAAPDCVLIALIKPQFEARKDQIGKGGVVRDAALHNEICQIIADWLAAQPDWEVIGISPSPILGPEGNKEFLIAGRRSRLQ